MSKVIQKRNGPNFDKRKYKLVKVEEQIVRKVGNFARIQIVDDSWNWNYWTDDEGIDRVGDLVRHHSVLNGGKGLLFVLRDVIAKLLLRLEKTLLVKVSLDVKDDVKENAQDL